MNVMRRYICFFWFLLTLASSSQLNAQDLIVTINSDSLNVKIEKETDRFIYYLAPNQGSSSLVISKKQVFDVVYGFYSSSDESEYNVVENENSNTSELDLMNDGFDHFQVSGSIGYSRLIVLIDEESQGIKEYYQKLLSGYNFSFQANYFFKKRFGVGFIFEQANFENSINDVLFTSGATTAYGTLSDDITITHIGPNFIFRLPFKRSASAMQFEAGFGYSSYVNIGKVSYDYEIRAYTVGISVGASYQLSLGGGLYVPLKIGIRSAFYLNGELKADDDMPDEFKSEIDGGLEEGGLSGDRFELSVGLLYAF